MSFITDSWVLNWFLAVRLPGSHPAQEKANALPISPLLWGLCHPDPEKPLGHWLTGLLLVVSVRMFWPH